MKKPYLNEMQRFAVRHNSTLGKFFMVDLRKKILYREFYRQRVFLKKVFAIVLSIVLVFSFIYSGVLITICYAISLVVVCILIYID